MRSFFRNPLVRTLYGDWLERNDGRAPAEFGRCLPKNDLPSVCA